jgi:hypothetical protein
MIRLSTICGLLLVLCPAVASADKVPAEKPNINVPPMTVLDVSMYHDRDGTLVLEMKVRANAPLRGWSYHLKCFDKDGKYMGPTMESANWAGCDMPGKGDITTRTVKFPPKDFPNHRLVSSLEWTLEAITLPPATENRSWSVPKDRPVVFKVKETAKPAVERSK